MLEHLRGHVYVRDECLEWAGSTHYKTGRPVVWWDGKGHLAQRLILQLSGRHAPSPSHVALIKCRNALCMNERHLTWGTRSDSMVAAVESGAVRTGLACAQKNIAAWRNRGAKMGFDRRDEVFALKDQGMTNTEIGRRFGVPRSAVYDALRRWSRPELLLSNCK